MEIGTEGIGVRVRMKLPACWTCEEFVEVVQRPEQIALARRYLGTLAYEVDDAVQGFIAAMIATARWRRYNPRRGARAQFVRRYLYLWCGHWRQKQERRERITRAYACSRRPSMVRPDTVVEVRERVERIRAAAAPVAREAIDAVLASGGDVSGAARLLGVDAWVVVRRCRGAALASVG